ncbi:unnamed protein product, partial [Effrenium voratum]
GYGGGFLVQKLWAALEAFLADESEIFMKVDDDSFVAWSRLCGHLTGLGPPVDFLYAGVPDMVNRSDWWFNSSAARTKKAPTSTHGRIGHTTSTPSTWQEA